ncbi:hypothetical protein [Arcanobacterium hippocoleae]|uniref:hypothetical protein n=1 Tax=Arcanobacterium hippocoleae TaxID=149017 RepID=UPI00333F1EBB
MALTAEMNHVKKTRMRVNHTGTTFRFVLVDRTSALMADHHEAQLKITPAIFVLGMFLHLQ